MPRVKKPGRYIGGELGAIQTPGRREQLAFCLIFPDLYEIGMSHQGLQILYHILNGDKRFHAERCYAPDVDMEAELRGVGLKLFSLETKKPLSEFDVLGITLPYELCYTNILTILDLAGLPFRAAERSDAHPLVIGGGSCGLNPEPVADFFDLIVLGDGEEVVVEIGEVLLNAREKGLPRDLVLKQLSAIDGVYVPSFFTPVYEGGEFRGIQPLLERYDKVTRRVLPELPGADLLTRPLVPLVKPIHDRLGIEIARGCTRGCRFCQAGMIYRPVRERSLEDILALAEQGIANSGFDELALLSLSTGDFSCLPEVLTRLMDRFAGSYVSVSMPSMRVGTLTPEVIDQVKRVRKTGFTVAPEAGTDRLREVINKGITEEDLLATCRDAFGAGWNLIKLYFMVGLPTETIEDVEAIASLAKRARSEAGGRGRVQINVSVATFVPKPHTPFQWHEQLAPDAARERIDLLKRLLPRKGFKLKWHDPDTSFLEGVFSRGDRRLARLIETAWRSGVRLDGWSEHFNLENWRRAAAECGIDLDAYLRARDMDAPLPWDHLDCGVDKTFLQEEYEKAPRRQYTPDCRNHGCQRCGLCDFKTIFPRTNKKTDQKEDRPSRPRAGKVEPAGQQGFRYRVRYARLGDSRFLGHLELLQLVFRALRRAGLPVLFSKGYNPSPRVSFSQALPLGMESLAEYFLVDLARPLSDLEAIRVQLGCQFPETMRILAIELAEKKKHSDQEAVYQISRSSLPPQDYSQAMAAFLAAESWPVERIRKGKRKILDIRPLVLSVGEDAETVEMTLLHPHGRAGLGPYEAMEHVLALTKSQARAARVLKISMGPRRD